LVDNGSLTKLNTINSADAAVDFAATANVANIADLANLADVAKIATIVANNGLVVAVQIVVSVGVVDAKVDRRIRNH
jgi:hypothetical protein